MRQTIPKILGINATAFIMLFMSNVVANTSAVPSTAEKIWDGELTKEKLDAFEKGAYTIVKGNVYIMKLDGRDLKPLKRLKRVEGDFYIGKYQDPLTTKEGKAKLVEGKIKLLNELQSTLVLGHMFSDLTEDEKRRLATHVSRNSLKGLASNKTLIPRSRKEKETFMDIYGNPSQDEFKVSVKAKPSGANAQLTSLKGLENLTRVTGNLLIELNPSLISLSALQALQRVGKITISKNHALKSLDGLNHLKRADVKYGGVNIWSNDALENIKALSGLKRVHSIYISKNKKLASLEGLEGIQQIAGHLWINDNEKLRDFTGLNNLELIADEFEVKGNNALKNFNGLNALEFIGNGFDVRNNQTLKNFKGLERLTEIHFMFQVKDNPALKSFNGLSNLTKIGYEFGISNNQKVTSFEGLNKLRSVSGKGLKIWKSPALTSLSGLDELTYIKDLSIYNPMTTKQLPKLEYVENLWVSAQKAELKQAMILPSLRYVGNLTFVPNEAVSDVKTILPQSVQIKELTVRKK